MANTRSELRIGNITATKIDLKKMPENVHCRKKRERPEKMRFPVRMRKVDTYVMVCYNNVLYYNAQLCTIEVFLAAEGAK